MKRRIYTDTSVIGGYLDIEFADASLQLFKRFRTGEDILVVSEITLLELERAPEDVRAVLDRVPEAYREEIELTEEAAELAEYYISAGAVSDKQRTDAQHISIATVYRTDVLVSWNFRHIVNLSRIHRYNSVNLRYGYPVLEIRTPREVISYDEE